MMTGSVTLADGIVGTVAGDTVFATGFGLSFSTWSATYCNTVNLCPYDLDGNGFVGANDLTLLLTEYGCTAACEYDSDGDGSVKSPTCSSFQGLW